jgi:hypothetical protein
MITDRELALFTVVRGFSISLRGSMNMFHNAIMCGERAQFFFGIPFCIKMKISFGNAFSFDPVENVS